MKRTILMLAALFFVSGASTANALIVDYIETYITTGATMDGMTVSTYNGTTLIDTYTWGYSIDDGITGTGQLSLTATGNTFFDNAWSLEVYNTSITTIILNGTTGNTVFDILNEPEDSNGNYDEHTTDSAQGKIFTPDSAGITGSYSDDVLLLGASTTEGDLFSTLTITLATDFYTDNNYDNNKNAYLASFSADTDNFNPVPEPSTVMLMALGLAGLFGYNLRRTNKKR